MPHRVLSNSNSSGHATSIRHASPGARRVDSLGRASPIRHTSPSASRVDSLGRATSIRVRSTRHAGSVQPPKTKASGSRPTIDSKGSPCPGGSGWQVPNRGMPTSIHGAVQRPGGGGYGVRIGQFEATTTALGKAILNTLRIRFVFTTPPLRLATSILGRCFRKPPPAEMVFPWSKRAPLHLR